MTTIDQFTNASGGHANAVFVVFNFFRDANDHFRFSWFER
jgi:hypothetical protein